MGTFFGAMGWLITIVVGFYVWRVQLIEKRRFDVAEEVLLGFNLAYDALSFARSPASFGNEGQSRPGRENETDEGLRGLRDSYWSKIERLNANAERFAALPRLSILTRYHFGPAAGQAVIDIVQARNRVMTAVSFLVRHAGDDRTPHALRMRMEGYIWGEDDPEEADLNPMLRAARATLEAALTPTLAQHSMIVLPIPRWLLGRLPAWLSRRSVGG